MSRFFVGQRVKLARPFNPVNVGRAGHISHLSFLPKGTNTGEGVTEHDSDCGVVWDNFGPSIYLQHTSQLEPIILPGLEPSELSIDELLPFLKEKDRDRTSVTTS